MTDLATRNDVYVQQTSSEQQKYFWFRLFVGEETYLRDCRKE